MDLKEIQQRNYQATKRRGLITSNTCESDFVLKLCEEVEEFAEDYSPEELADVVLVAFACAEHFNIDLFDEMKKKTLYNEKRK